MSLIEVVKQTNEEIDRDERRERHKWDLELWAREIGGYHLWSLQAEVARSIAENQNVVVKAGHGVGKSWLAALAICWWIDTRYPKCFVASTAPSTAQIGAIVWREVHNIRARIQERYDAGLIDHKLPGYITSDPAWKTDDGVVIGFGRKPPDQKTDDAFQGLHAEEGVLAVGDEAVGLTEDMIDALGNITSTSSSRRFLICNPTNPASHVGKLFKEKPGNWAYHTISVLKNPNFTSEGETTPLEVLKSLSDQSFVDGKREEYGEGSPKWISRIEGEFVWDLGFTLISYQDIAKAMDTEIIPDPEIRPVLGVDVSRSKRGDKNTIYVNTGGKIRFVDSWNEPNAMETARRIHKWAEELAVTEVRIDGVGLGGPVADRVRELSYGLRGYPAYEVIEILGGDASPDIQRWYNFRAWSWWSLQDRMSRGEIDLDPEDTDLHEQLMGVELKKRLSGRDNILLESKEEMAKRGVNSPDLGDAAVYASLDLEEWKESLPEGTIVAEDREWEEDLAYSSYLTSPGMPYM